MTLAAEIRDAHGVEVDELNLGGGLGIAYVPATTRRPRSTPSTGLSGSSSASVRRPACAVRGCRSSRDVRSSGPATITVYEVGTVKRVSLDGGAVRTYVSVDGGMSDNIRTALYDAEYTCTVANRASSATPVLAASWASTARAATSSCATPGCRATSRRAT